jgi:uncharacterized membrane protein
MAVGTSARIPSSPVERALTAAGAVVLLSWIAFAIAVWGKIPARVPVHFGASGLPDAWGDRPSLLLLPVLGVVLFAVLSAVERLPQLYNYPVTVTPENAQALYRLGRQLIVTLKLTMTCIFAYIFWAAVRVAQGQMRGLSVWFLPVTLIIVGGTIALFVPKMFRLKQGPRPSA